MLLGSLAHNVLIWMRSWLSQVAPQLAGFGLLRLVRDVLGVSGFVELGELDSIRRIVLNRNTMLARRCIQAFRALLRSQRVAVRLSCV